MSARYLAYLYPTASLGLLFAQFSQLLSGTRNGHKISIN
jgi:hypothetical protein